MSENKLAILAVIIFMVCQFGFFWITTDSLNHRTIKYDCSIAEISPDFPPQVREQCRQLRAQRGRF